MATESDWWVEQFPSSAELTILLGTICAECGLGADAYSTAWTADGDACVVTIRAPQDKFAEFRAWYERNGQSFTVRVWDEWFEAHDEPEPRTYAFEFDIACASEDDPPSVWLSTEASSDDNSSAWPVAEMFASWTAERLGIHALNEDRHLYDPPLPC